MTAQQSDPFCTDIRRKLNGGVVVAFGFDEDGILCRQVSHQQIVIPHLLKARVLHIHHYARQSGHPGGRKLYNSLRRHMYWPAMAVDCYATVRKCATCAKNRIKLRQRTNKLQLFPPSGPLESVAIDIFGELLKTKRGFQYLLVISDRFTKLTKTIPLKGVSAGEVARAFTHEWVFNYGPPQDLLADNGKCFTSKFFQSVCSILNVDNQFTTTYHPQTNGQVERYNRTLKAAIKSYLDDHPTDWDLYTPTLTYAYNCQPHSTTSLAPFELVLSRPPPPLAIQSRPKVAQSVLESHDKWRQWLSKTIGEARKKLDQAQARYKRNYDKRLRRQSENILKGDNVYLRVERRDESQTRHNLASVAEGPFKVESVKGNTVVILRPDNSVERVSRDRVTIAPARLTAAEVQDRVRPMTDTELTPKSYPTPEDVNLKDVIRPLSDEKKQPQQTQQDIPSVVEGNAPGSQAQSERDTPLAERNREAGKPNTDERRRKSKRILARTTQQQQPRSVAEDEDRTQPNTQVEDREFVVDRIVSHGINEDAEHPTARVGDTTYRVRWYGFGAEEDTFEPIHHLPRNKLVSYYKRKKLALPVDIHKAVAG